MLIIGAGLSGLIAGMMLPDAHIVEAGSREQINHKALLRFRSPDVGRVTGVDFKKVLVRKGIWMDDKFHEPNIRLANMYSQKVTGKIQNRSIWDIAPVERWIAPEDFAQRIAARLASRISWDSPYRFDFNRFPQPPIITTIPMSAMVKALHGENAIDQLEEESSERWFSHERIVVGRYRVPNCNVHQTIYFPDPETSVYRASITGDMMIIESIQHDDSIYQFVDLLIPHSEVLRVFDAFHLYGSFTEIGVAQQKFGKISPIDDTWRRHFIRDLSQNHKVYSLGRFATWRNILLDDVVNDVYVIKCLIESDAYDGARIGSYNYITGEVM